VLLVDTVQPILYNTRIATKERALILADTVKTLTSLTPTSLAQVLKHSGHKDAAFKAADFVGITNGGEFAYKITFFDRESTGKDQVGKVFVKYDTVSGYMTADY
jgi:hypothetical protein